MLKSYEAVYHNGHLHWIGLAPPVEIDKRRVMVVVDVEEALAKPATNIQQLLAKTRGCVKPLQTIDEIDANVTKMRAEWDREWDR